MDKEEILRKVKSEQTGSPDEREIQITQKGNGIAMLFILLFCVVLMIVKMIKGLPWYDVYSICFIANGAQHMYRGIKMKQKHEIVLGISFSLLALFALIAYIYEIVTE